MSPRHGGMSWALLESERAGVRVYDQLVTGGPARPRGARTLLFIGVMILCS